MRLKLTVSVEHEEVKYREFSRVIDVPVMPKVFRVGGTHVAVEEHDSLLYDVREECYDLFLELEFPERWAELNFSPQDWSDSTCESLVEDGFVEFLCDEEEEGGGDGDADTRTA